MNLQEKVAARDRLDREIKEERETALADRRNKVDDIWREVQQYGASGSSVPEFGMRKNVHWAKFPGGVTVCAGASDERYAEELSITLADGTRMDFSAPVPVLTFTRVLEALIGDQR